MRVSAIAVRDTHVAIGVLRAILRATAVAAAGCMAACSGSDAVGPALPPPAACADYATYIHVIDSFSSGADVGHIVVRNGYAYVSGYASPTTGVFQVLDVDAGETSVLANLAIGRNAGEIAVARSVAYVATGSGLHVIDVSQPDVPAVIATVPVSSLRSLAATDSVVYLTRRSANSEWTLDVVRTTTPAEPRTIRSLSNVGSIVRVRDRYAVTAGERGLQVMDVADPERPFIIGIDGTRSYWPGDMALGESHAYVLDSGNLYVVDMSAPRNPRIAGSTGLPPYCSSLALAPPFVIVTANLQPESGLLVVDVSVPRAPRVVWKVKTQGYVESACMDGNLAYVTGGEHGVHRLEISSASRNAMAGTAATSSVARGIAADGARAYIAASTHGVAVFDIANADPTPLMEVDTPGTALQMALAGTHAFVADGPAGVQVLELSSFGAALAGCLDTPGCAYSVVTYKHNVLVADGDAGLHVVDVSVPEHPRSVGSIGLGGVAYDIAVAGPMAYVAMGGGVGSGLSVVEIVDPSHPTLASSAYMAGTALRVSVAGWYAYVTTTNEERGSAFHVIDVSDPYAPVKGRELAIDGDANDLAVNGGFAYIAGRSHAGGSCVWVIDLSSPADPVLAGCMQSLLPMNPGDTGIGALGIALSGGRAYVAGADLVVFPLQCP